MSGCRLALKPRGTQFPLQPGTSITNRNLNLISFLTFRIGVRTAPSAIKACLREAATPLYLPGLYQPLNSKRPSPWSLMCSASRKCPPLLRCSITRLRRNRPWCIVHKLATPQELAGLLGPQIHGTTGGPPQPCLRSQRGMLSRNGWKLRWDLDTSYPPRTIPVPWISPSRF